MICSFKKNAGEFQHLSLVSLAILACGWRENHDGPSSSLWLQITSEPEVLSGRPGRGECSHVLAPLGLQLPLNTVAFYCCYFLFFLAEGGGGLHCMACGILVPQPRIEHGPSGVRAWSPSHQTAREYPGHSFKLNPASAMQGPGGDNNVPDLIADPLSTSSELKKKWGSGKKFCSFLLPNSEPAKVRSFSFNTKASLLLIQQSAKYFCVTYELRIVFTF